MMAIIVNTSGKRKQAIARATVKKGKGRVRINRQLLETIRPTSMRLKMQEPLLLAGELSGEVDVSVSVRGGGPASQTEAARLAIAKGLVQYSKSAVLEDRFLSYDRQLLVADVRRKESAKPNRHGQARAKGQKSYR